MTDNNDQNGKRQLELAKPGTRHIEEPVPLSESFSVIGELYYHGKRLEVLKNEAEGLFGMNWRVGGRGTIRAAVAFGLEDGSPDWTATAGYAAQF